MKRARKKKEGTKMTKFKIQYEGAVDGVYAVFEKLAGDPRFSVKMEVTVTVTESFEHPPNPTEDWGGYPSDEEMEESCRNAREARPWDFAWEEPELQPRAPALESFLPIGLRRVGQENTLAGRCVKAAYGWGIKDAGWDAAYGSISAHLTGAQKVLEREGTEGCMKYLEETLDLDSARSGRMVDVLWAEKEHLAEPAREVRGGWDPEPPKPVQTLGEILKEKLGNKLLLNSLTGRCLKALGYVHPSSDFLLQHEKIQKLLPEALETLHNKGYWACVDFLEASGVPAATPMVDVLLKEPRPVMATPPGDGKPIQVAVLDPALSYNELAKGCMQFYKGLAETVARDEKEIMRYLPEVLNMLPRSKLNAIKILRDGTGIGLREAKDMVEFLEGK